MARTRTRYKPANRASDLHPGSGMQAFDAFMLSEQMRRPVRAATEAVAAIAVEMYLAEASETGALAESVDVQDQVVTINGNPRVAGAVTAHGGTPERAKDPESSVAAIIEWGNPRGTAYGAAPREGLHILARAGQTHDTPKLTRPT